MTLHPLWKALDDAGVEVLLTGHSHNYERFAPRDGNGKTSAVGIREFVVGTGGAFMTGLSSQRMPGSEAAQNHTFGVLKLTLHALSYRLAVRPGRREDAGGLRLRPVPRSGGLSARSPSTRPDH